MLLVQGQAYRQQYGFNATYLQPANLHGPGDNFGPRSYHVIPALIKKCVDAIGKGADHIDVWGTGRASREFLFVDDAAEGIVLAARRCDSPEPVILGTRQGIKIRELVQLIAEVGTSAARSGGTRPYQMVSREGHWTPAGLASCSFSPQTPRSRMACDGPSPGTRPTHRRRPTRITSRAEPAHVRAKDR
jgi:nucleoside-diphosphate-sugar epimerase